MSSPFHPRKFEWNQATLHPQSPISDFPDADEPRHKAEQSPVLGHLAECAAVGWNAVGWWFASPWHRCPCGPATVRVRSDACAGGWSGPWRCDKALGETTRTSPASAEQPIGCEGLEGCHRAPSNPWLAKAKDHPSRLVHAALGRHMGGYRYQKCSTTSHICRGETVNWHGPWAIKGGGWRASFLKQMLKGFRSSWNFCGADFPKNGNGWVWKWPHSRLITLFHPFPIYGKYAKNIYLQ